MDEECLILQFFRLALFSFALCISRVVGLGRGAKRPDSDHCRILQQLRIRAVGKQLNQGFNKRTDADPPSEVRSDRKKMSRVPRSTMS
jgi:hypothetical protein